jgi:hypothetical protein
MAKLGPARKTEICQDVANAGAGPKRLRAFAGRQVFLLFACFISWLVKCK